MNYSIARTEYYRQSGVELIAGPLKFPAILCVFGPVKRVQEKTSHDAKPPRPLAHEPIVRDLSALTFAIPIRSLRTNWSRMRNKNASAVTVPSKMENVDPGTASLALRRCNAGAGRDRGCVVVAAWRAAADLLIALFRHH